MSEPWWRTAVIYQVYPRSFADSDGDGIGDLRGVIQHLDHLQYLGVDAIWLSPVFRSPHDDNGYDISDYQAIDPAFGSLDDFDDLVAQAHERGIRIVLDLVVNHTSDEHPWFESAATGNDSPHRDWYWWRPPRPGFVGGEPGAEPNNWGSFFSGSAWEWHEPSGEYYLHLFSRKQPDLNWENPEVRAAVYRMMNWWLDRGVDGFRMDVINLISKTPGLPDGVCAPGARFGDGFPLYAAGPRIHEFLQEMHERVFAAREGTFVTIGEMPGVTTEQARAFTDPERRELDMVFQFDHVGIDHGPTGKWDPVPMDLVELKRSLARWQDELADVGWNSLYWNNHDQPRAVSRFGSDGVYRERSATALATVLHLQRGTPFIYQGEELGMTNVQFSRIDDFRDIESLNYFAEASALVGADPAGLLAGMGRASRDNARTPVQWTAERNAGFTDGEPWIPVNANHAEVNAAEQHGRPGSVLEYYRALIRMRHEERLVIDGRFRLIAGDDPTVFAFERVGGDGRLLVVANISDDPRSHDTLPAELREPGGELIICNVPQPGVDELLPWEAWVRRI